MVTRGGGGEVGEGKLDEGDQKIQTSSYKVKSTSNLMYNLHDKYYQQCCKL